MVCSIFTAGALQKGVRVNKNHQIIVPHGKDKLQEWYNSLILVHKLMEQCDSVLSVMQAWNIITLS